MVEGHQTLACPPARSRVGVDLVAVAEVEQSVRRLGRSYLDRVYTALEQSDTDSSDPGVRAEGLAARFAAKEAVLKVLRPGADPPVWLELEVRREPDGSASLALGPAAMRLATTAGLTGWSVSLSHHAGMAVAVVLADATAAHDGGGA